MRSSIQCAPCLRFVQLSILGLVLAWIGCAREASEARVKAPVKVDVASVNGETISEAELVQFLKDESLNDQRPVSRGEGLNRLIRQKVLAQEARKAGFSASPEEASGMIGLAPAGEKEAEVPGQSLFGLGTPDSDLSLDRIQDYLLIQKFLLDKLQAEQPITLRQLLLYYEEHQDQYQIDEQCRVLEILVADRSEAETIRRELRPGDFRQFREKAQLVSSGVGAEEGGDLGLFRRGELPIRFEEVIFKLAVGELSAVFRSEMGYHLFTIEERIPRHAQKYYEVQDQIFGQLVADREREGLDELVNQMMESASIEIFDPSLSRDWRKSDAQLP